MIIQNIFKKKYPEMNTGTKNMYGVPVTVTVSSAFLEKCNKDPQKAAFLEENLAVTNECVKEVLHSQKICQVVPL